MRFGEQDRHSYAIEKTPPRNVDADRAEWMGRNAPPLPPSAFIPPPTGGQMSGEQYMNAQRAEERRAKEAEQQIGSILDAAVERLGVLLEAVADQNAGRPLTDRQWSAFGDFARMLDTAKNRRIGLGPAGAYSIGVPAAPVAAPVAAAPVAVAPPRIRTRTR